MSLAEERKWPDQVDLLEQLWTQHEAGRKEGQRKSPFSKGILNPGYRNAWVQGMPNPGYRDTWVPLASKQGLGW